MHKAKIRITLYRYIAPSAEGTTFMGMTPSSVPRIEKPSCTHVGGHDADRRSGMDCYVVHFSSEVAAVDFVRAYWAGVGEDKSREFAAFFHGEVNSSRTYDRTNLAPNGSGWRVDIMGNHCLLSEDGRRWLAANTNLTE